MTIRFRALLLSGILLAALLSPAGAAPPESEVRAAIIINFMHFVEWPDAPAADRDMLVCIAGMGPTAGALLAFNGRLVHGRKVSVEIRPHGLAVANCRMLFIGETSNRSPLDWLRDVAGHPILTVSEGEDFLPNGGGISLNRSGSRVIFDINLSAVHRSKLRIGSQLLRLAHDIHGK